MKHPPFKATRPPSKTKDTMTREGANFLAREIQQVWASCGYDVVPMVVLAQDNKTDGIWVVRMPTLCNGLPMRVVGS